MENLELNLEELYDEVKRRAEEEGAYSREEWDDIVEMVIEEKRENGELHDDDSTYEIAEALKARYEEMEEEIEEM